MSSSAITENDNDGSKARRPGTNGRSVLTAASTREGPVVGIHESRRSAFEPCRRPVVSQSRLQAVSLVVPPEKKEDAGRAQMETSFADGKGKSPSGCKETVVGVRHGDGERTRQHAVDLVLREEKGNGRHGTTAGRSRNSLWASAASYSGGTNSGGSIGNGESEEKDPGGSRSYLAQSGLSSSRSWRDGYTKDSAHQYSRQDSKPGAQRVRGVNYTPGQDDDRDEPFFVGDDAEQPENPPSIRTNTTVSATEAPPPAPFPSAPSPTKKWKKILPIASVTLFLVATASVLVALASVRYRSLSDGSPKMMMGSARFEALREELGVSDDPSPAQSMALLWIADHDPAMLPLDTMMMTLEQRYSVAALYFATNGHDWDKDCNFLSNDGVCEWHDGVSGKGVFCDATGTVVEIRLNSNGLQGTIPAELSTLSALTSLELQENLLQDSIPTILGAQLSSLKRLDLSENDLDGPIPSEIGWMGSLEELNLSRNRLIGTLPKELGNLLELRTAILSFLLLEGTIPYELMSLSRLETLHLERNFLRGDLNAVICSSVDTSELDLRADCGTGGGVTCDCCQVCCDTSFLETNGCVAP